MEVVEAHSVTLESVVDNLDIKTFGIFAAVGKIEIDNFKERAALGKRGVAKRGRMPIGSLPYGYRIGEDGRPVIDPVEGPVVQRIFRAYVQEDKGVPTILQELTPDEAPLRKGSKWGSWSSSQIHRMLGAEVYIGTWWYGKERHTLTEEGRRRLAQPRETWIKMSFPPLVDRETWDRAQVLKIERRSLSKRNTRSFYLLQRLMVCGQCGMRFTARTHNRNTVKKNGRTYEYEYSKPRRYYICQGMFTHKLKCREHPYIKADPIEDMVWSEVAKTLRNPETIVQGLQGLEESTTELLKQIAEAERQLHRVQAEEDRAIRLHVSGKITEAQLDRQRKFIIERLEQANDNLDRLRAQNKRQKEKESVADAVTTWAKEVEVGLETLTPEERQQVLRLVVDHVKVEGDSKARITLAIPTPEFVSIDSQRSSCWLPP